MRTIFLLVLALTGSTLALAESAGLYSHMHTVFDALPHEKILKTEISRCEEQAENMGEDQARVEKSCKPAFEKSFAEMVRLNNKRITPNDSWSLCLNESKDGDSYDYTVAVKCMRVVNELCPVDQDFNYIDAKKCFTTMNNHFWVNDPKIDEPIQP
ncbi:hypothetical protein [Aquirhabdus sp.]|uniref:hypothetical protein n=1 Tax=Aquirhabdus sp. TaxID=2824160 RepID=UPI00396CD4B5